MTMFNVIEYNNIVVGQVQAATEFHAWEYAMNYMGHHYGIYVVEVR